MFLVQCNKCMHTINTVTFYILAVILHNSCSSSGTKCKIISSGEIRSQGHTWSKRSSWTWGWTFSMHHTRQYCPSINPVLLSFHTHCSSGIYTKFFCSAASWTLMFWHLRIPNFTDLICGWTSLLYESLTYELLRLLTGWSSIKT